MSAAFASGGNVAGLAIPVTKQPPMKKHVALNITGVTLWAAGTLLLCTVLILTLLNKYVYAQTATATSFNAKMNTVQLFNFNPLKLLIVSFMLFTLGGLTLTVTKRLTGFKGRLFTWLAPSLTATFFAVLFFVPFLNMGLSQTGTGNAIAAANQQLTAKAEGWLVKNYGVAVSLAQPKELGDSVTKTYLLKSLTTGDAVTFKYTLDDVNLNITGIQTQPLKAG